MVCSDNDMWCTLWSMCARSHTDGKQRQTRDPCGEWQSIAAELSSQHWGWQSRNVLARPGWISVTGTQHVSKRSKTAISVEKPSVWGTPNLYTRVSIKQLKVFLFEGSHMVWWRGFSFVQSPKEALHKSQDFNPPLWGVWKSLTPADKSSTTCWQCLALWHFHHCFGHWPNCFLVVLGYHGSGLFQIWMLNQRQECCGFKLSLLFAYE